MSLYDYTLYVVRETARGELLSNAIDRDLVRVIGKPRDGDRDGTCIGGRVSCTLRSDVSSADPSLAILTIALDERTLEAFLGAHGSEFSEWLWRIAEALQPVCFFMSGGSDMSYIEKGEPMLRRTFLRLPALVERGELSGIHPIMYFAERIAEGALCRKAQGVPWPSVEYRPGLGCLLMFAGREATTGALDIWEPGNVYDELRSHFD